MLDIAFQVAIGDKQIAVAVVVGIEKARPPRQIGNRALAQPGEEGLIDKGAVAEVFVQGIGLPLKVGDEKVVVAVVVVVAHVNAHARFDVAVLVVRHAGQQCFFGKVAGAVVEIQEVQGLVVGQVEIGVAIEIHVAENHAEFLALGTAQPGGHRDVGKGAVALVPIQHIRHPVKSLRTAVELQAAAALGADAVVGIREVVVIAHVQIDEAVAVNVGKRSTRSPALVADLGGPGHIRKRSIALVPIQHIGAEVGDVQVEVAVVVRVADR